MAEGPPKVEVRERPLIVYTHVTPWGFMVALPFALALAYLGAWALDIGVTGHSAAGSQHNPLWLFGIPLLGFALFLFLVGVGELARYLKPSVEVAIDPDGITTYGMMGARRILWSELVEVRIDDQHIALRARHKGTPKTMRLHFNRLAVEPAHLVRRIERHRPDLPPILVSH